jgi:hypothetical protein
MVATAISCTSDVMVVLLELGLVGSWQKVFSPHHAIFMYSVLWLQSNDSSHLDLGSGLSFTSNAMIVLP